MDFSRTDAAQLFNEDGSIDLPLLTRHLHERPTGAFELARQVNIFVTEKLMTDPFDGGWREEGSAQRAIEISAWLNRYVYAREPIAA